MPDRIGGPPSQVSVSGLGLNDHYRATELITSGVDAVRTGADTGECGSGRRNAGLGPDSRRLP